MFNLSLLQGIQGWTESIEKIIFVAIYLRKDQHSFSSTFGSTAYVL